MFLLLLLQPASFLLLIVTLKGENCASTVPRPVVVVGINNKENTQKLV